MKAKYVSLLWILVLLLSACTSAQPEPTAVPATNTVPPPPTEVAASPTVPPTEAPVPTEEVAQDACVSCHTDQQRLTETAMIEEIAEEESEGVG